MPGFTNRDTNGLVFEGITIVIVEQVPALL